MLLSRRYDSPEQALLTALLSQRLGAVFAALAFRLRLRPDMVTLLGLAFMLAACPAFVSNSPSAWMLAAVLLQVGFAFDCADGQLARAQKATSERGAWLDVACDHVRQVALTFSVAYVLIETEQGILAALLACAALQTGFTVYLHTATVLKTERSAALGTAGWRQAIRMLLRNLLDTPVYLLLLCAFRCSPEWLLVFVSSYGGLLFVRGFSLGFLRLKGPVMPASPELRQDS